MNPDRPNLLNAELSAAEDLSFRPTIHQTHANPSQSGHEGALRPGIGSSDIAAYEALTNESMISVLNLRDLEMEAKKILPPYSYAYISGGSGDEWTMRANEIAFDRWVIEPKFLAGVKAPDLTTRALSSELSLPVITAPMGGQGIAHALKELPDVEGTSASGTLYVNSSVSHLTMEEIAAAATGPKWFQIYFPENRRYASELLHRARHSGYKALVVTVDNTNFGNRERTVRLGIPAPNLGPGNGVKTPGIDPATTGQMKVDLDWEDIAFCQKESDLPVIIKGVLTPAMARETVRQGCAGIWVSNHGGRAIDNTAPAIDALSQIAGEIGDKALIIMDGGVRRGQDVFRALALGAHIVALGRPILYGMALGGAQGVHAVYARLKSELQMVMQLAGTPNISSISRDYVRRLDA
jgi:lactate oxidase